MVPYTLKRDSSGYHDTKLQPQSSSASAIRNALRHWEEQPFSRYPADPQQTPDGFSELLQNQLPEKRPASVTGCMESILSHWNKWFLPFIKIPPALRNPGDLYVSIRIYPRILQTVSSETGNQFLNFEQFCQLLKTKELTYSRISRGLLHILLDVKKKICWDTGNLPASIPEFLDFVKNMPMCCVRIKENASIPVITKLGQTDSLLPETIRMLDQTTFASDLYESVVSDKFGIPFINEYQKQIIHV